MAQNRNPYENMTGYEKHEEVRKKSAVITARLQEEKSKTAVALGYDPEDTAPKIIASGRGVLADKIIETAKENQVPVHKDERLANTLSKLEVGDFIPPELYEVVAEVLMFVDRLDRIKEKVMKDKDTTFLS